MVHGLNTSKVCVCGGYLWVCQAGVVGLEVVDDAQARSRQGDAAHQEHNQHNVREGGRQVHHLEGIQGRGHGGAGTEGGHTHTHVCRVASKNDDKLRPAKWRRCPVCDYTYRLDERFVLCVQSERLGREHENMSL